jgi:hypothetical protein
VLPVTVVMGDNEGYMARLWRTVRRGDRQFVREGLKKGRAPGRGAEEVRGR